MIIRTMFIITICAIVVFTAFAVISIRWSSNALKSAIEEKTYYEAAQCANQISMIFENAEGSVDALASDILHGFNVAAYKKDQEYLDRYMKKLSPVIKSALTDVEDAAGLYFTFDPALSDYKGTYEIWYSLDAQGRAVYTDAMENGIYLEAFSYLDAPHMQYYFRSVKKPMEGIWTDPGYDPDIKKEVLTYSKSVYSDGILIGVLGTDIFTDHTTDIISHMDVDNDGKVFLLNRSNKQVIASSQGADMDAAGLWKKCASEMKKNPGGMIHTALAGQDILVSYHKLSNGWMLAIVNDKNDLFVPIDLIRILIALLSLILAILTIAVTYFALKRFASPVKKATELLQMMELEEPIRQEDKERVQTEEDIEELVRKQINKQREKDLLLAHQSRLAQAGEMLAGIAHQWKQPLNKLSIVLGNLRDSHQYGELTNEGLEESIAHSETIIASMSETIDDFRSYMKPERDQEDFSVQRVVNAVLDLLHERLSMNHICVELVCREDLQAHGYKNALYHVILNVVNNAIEAIQEGSVEQGKIRITIKRSDQHQELIEIQIFNNGPALAEEIKDKLFSSYVTTKDRKGGSGLGLAISKSLVETAMDGSIRLGNVEGGVNCVVQMIGSED